MLRKLGLHQSEPAQSCSEKVVQLCEMLHRWRRSLDAQMPTRNPNYKPAKAEKQQAQQDDQSLLLRMARD